MVGSYTDVLVSVGSFAFKTPILEQSLDELRKASKPSSTDLQAIGFCGYFEFPN